jgi:hypothetical protein
MATWGSLSDSLLKNLKSSAGIAARNRGLRQEALDNRKLAAEAGFGQNSMWNRLGKTAKWGGSNIMASGGGTWGGAAKGIGMHALKGGVAGGLAGGTLESAQGGSFWSGAKSGAWNGAVGWSGYRTMGRAAGVKGPFKTASAFQNMYAATGSGKISKQAINLLNQKQRDGLTRMTMNTR